MSSISKVLTSIEGISGDGNNRVRVEFRRFSLPTGWFLAMLTVPMFIALGISAYLAYASMTSSEVAGCSGGEIFDCSHVLYSKWSKVLGFPVSGLAFLTYVGMILATAVTCIGRLSNKVRLTAWSVVTGLAITAALAALYFIYLQVFVLEHLCPWCLGAHACGLLIAIAILLSSFRIALPPLGLVTGLAAAGLAVMIGIQVNSKEPPKFVVKEYVPEALVNTNEETFTAAPADFDAPPGEDDFMMAPPGEDDLFAPPEEDEDFMSPPVEDEDEFEEDFLEDGEADTASSLRIQFSILGQLALVRSPLASVMLLQDPVASQQQKDGNKKPAKTEKQKPKKPEPRIVEFMGRKLNAHQWPIDGKPTAKHVFVEMFDYTCPHCRTTSKALFKVKESMGDDLAVVVLPVPMKMACNPVVQRDHPSHAEACELAVLAVAVWRCDKSKFSEFHKWMFEGEKAPQYVSALGKASALVGKERVEKELKKNTSKAYIQRHCQMYKMLNGGVVPKLLFPTRSIEGEFTAVDSLSSMIQQDCPAGN
jgi:uncharacterized membrane protein/protein-disulfide isomerase